MSPNAVELAGHLHLPHAARELMGLAATASQ
jgi:hypothetical protein